MDLGKFLRKSAGILIKMPVFMRSEFGKNYDEKKEINSKVRVRDYR